MLSRKNFALALIVLSAGLVLSSASADDPEFEFRFHEPDDGTGNIDVETTISLEVEIENFDSSPKTMDLAITNKGELQQNGLRAWWSNDGKGDLSSESSDLNGIELGDQQEYENIAVTIEASENAPYGTYAVKLKCLDTEENDDDKKEQRIELQVNVNEKAAITVEIDNEGSKEGSIDIDADTVYQLKINNDGNKEDTISLSAISEKWEFKFDEDSITVEAFESKAVNITITSDKSVDYGDSEKTTVTATSGNSGETKGTLEITTFVRVKYGLGITTVSDSKKGGVGETVTFNFRILNKWSDTVDYEIIKKKWYRGSEDNQPDQAWSFTAGGETLDLYEERTTSNSESVKVRISDSATVGEVVTLIVTARITDDEENIGAVDLTLKITVEGNYNIQLIVSDDQITISTGTLKGLEQYVRLKNFAKVTDQVTITAKWQSGGEDWKLNVPEPIPIEASGEKGVYISVEAPAGSEGGQALLNIKAESNGDDTVSFETTLTFFVNSGTSGTGPEIDQIPEENDFPVDPLLLVSIVLIIGLGGSAVFALQQKSKGAFGGSGEKVDDFSDEWAGMGGAEESTPQMAAPQPPSPPPAAPPATPTPAAPPQPQAPPSMAAVPEQAATPQPELAPAPPTILTITVPDGVMAGQQIQIKAPSGQLVSVKVPEGCGPGSQFKIQI